MKPLRLAGIFNLHINRHFLHCRRHPAPDAAFTFQRHFSHNGFANFAAFQQKIQRMVGGKHMSRQLRQVAWLNVGGIAI